MERTQISTQELAEEHLYPSPRAPRSHPLLLWLRRRCRARLGLGLLLLLSCCCGGLLLHSCLLGQQLLLLLLLVVVLHQLLLLRGRSLLHHWELGNKRLEVWWT